MPVQQAKAAASLRDLVAPLSESDFVSMLRERKLTLLRATEGIRYKPWLGWESLKRLIERGECPRGDEFRVSKESVMIPPADWSQRGRIDTAKLEEYLEKGFSIVIAHVEPYVPPLAALCDDIRSQLNESSFAGVIVTSGTDGAFRIHYDPEDLIILQVEGTKRWQIFGPAVANPVNGMPKQTAPSKSAPVFDEVLEPGDLLFVPGGYWHHCQAGLERSVHLGIFFLPPTGYHAVKALTAQLLSEELFRKPLTRFEDGSGLTALEADVKQRLVDLIGHLDLGAFLSEWKQKP